MSEENKAFVQGLFEVMDKGDWRTVREMMDPGHVFHGSHFLFPLAPKPLDREGHIQLNTSAAGSVFTNVQHVIEDQIAEADKVVTRGFFRFTHTGEFQGIPPSGREVTIPFINIMRVFDGRNAEEWDAADSLGMMQQMSGTPTT